jgi:putative addiction module antidote
MANAVIETKLRAIGNSTGLVIPKEVLDELGLKQGDKIFLVKSDNVYKITAYDPSFQKQMEAAQEGMQKYRNALSELAK